MVYTYIYKYQVFALKCTCTWVSEIRWKFSFFLWEKRRIKGRLHSDLWSSTAFSEIRDFWCDCTYCPVATKMKVNQFAPLKNISNSTWKYILWLQIMVLAPWSLFAFYLGGLNEKRIFGEDKLKYYHNLISLNLAWLSINYTYLVLRLPNVLQSL